MIPVGAIVGTGTAVERTAQENQVRYQAAIGDQLQMRRENDQPFFICPLRVRVLAGSTDAMAEQRPCVDHVPWRCSRS